ncbi:MAG: hypothetical protein CVV49_22030 [Spirochaetae bacterium HGW-Spirochaetae-5]|nr:MAG: hypothetical protein CVV49_22030 [Spirochaetae bacterium HGW-Spirochaetae-5]
MDVKLNDWVTGYSKGFFKIIKTFPIYYDESCYDIHKHKVGEENHNSIVVLKKGFRFVSTKLSLFKLLSFDLISL